jgi:hypothetical protein
MRIMKTLGAAFLLVGTVGAVLAFGAFGEVVSSFPVPPKTGTGGLAWDGTYLWFSGRPYSYIIRTTTLGSVVSSFKASETFPSDIRALTFDGEYLWYSVYRAIGGYAYVRATTTGSRVKIIGAGYGDPGLAWEPPRYLWIGPYKITTTGSRVASFNSPFYLGGDLAWYGHYLWTGGGNRYYYQLTTKGSIVASFAVPGNAAAGGTTFDGNYIWLVNSTASYVYQVDIDVVGMNPGSFGKIKGLYR